MVLKYSLGVDVASEKFDVNLSTIDSMQNVKVVASHKFSNTQKGFLALHHWLQKKWKTRQEPMVVTMEATGIYYEMLALFLFKQGYTVAVVLPNKAKKYMQSCGVKSKNDKIDAKGLARMGAEQSLAPWEPMIEFYYELRELTRQHESLQGHRTVVTNQLHATSRGMYPNMFVTNQLKSMIAAIDEQIKATEVAISKLIASNPQVQEKARRITKIKGLGLLTVAVLIAETNGFTLFENSRQLVSYAGYDVIENQSGNRTGKTRISKKGNSRLRRALHMPALSVVRWRQAPFINLYERTLERHSIKMKSYVAVQKKLLVIIYALWKSGRDFDTNYEHQRLEEIKKAA